MFPAADTVPRATIAQPVSLYLDLLRFLAAFVVFLQHFSWAHFSGGVLWQITPYGAQAVIVFFVLSGYLIGHVTSRPGANGRDYALDRAARLWSVALPALLLTFALDAVGQMLRPDLFTGDWFNDDESVPLQFVRNALFLNQLWWGDDFPGSNVPYWSLGYEAWYYVVFGLLLFAPRALGRGWGLVAAGAALLIAGPRIAAMFPVWLLGVLVQRLSVRGWPRSRGVGWTLFIGAPLAWAGFEWWLVGMGLRTAQPLPAHGWELWQDQAVGLLVALHLMGVGTAAPLLAKVLTPAGRAIRWLAARSFTLYLMQMPLLQFFLVICPFPFGGWAQRLFIAVGALAMVPLLALVTELRRKEWRRTLSRVIPAT